MLVTMYMIAVLAISNTSLGVLKSQQQGSALAHLIMRVLFS